MTVMELPRVAVRPAPAVLRSASGWRFAVRLARREVRRRPGRTLLVVLLVLVPVMGMTIADVVQRTKNDSWAETYQRRYGTSDLAIDGPLTPALRSLLPAGARVVEHRFAQANATVAGRADSLPLQFSDLPLTDSITAGMFEVRAGRIPTSPGEALLTPRVADAFHVGVGDTLALTHPGIELAVVGIGVTTDWYSDARIIVSGFEWLPPVTRGGSSYLIDTSAPLTNSELASLRSSIDYVQVPNRAPASNNAATLQRVWGFVAGVLALTVLGIIIAAAFATSARRQLLTLGQLSANGAGQRLLRRTMALQGSVSGLVGGVAGVFVSIALLVVGKSVIFERVFDRSLGSYQWPVVDLVVIITTTTLAATVAAFIPARTIARVPVLSALAGRRPLGRVPHWLVPVGLGVFGSGLGLMVLAAMLSRNPDTHDGNIIAAVGIIGGLGVLLGACCISPAVVGLLGPLGERFRGPPKLAARSMARLRTRSAAVVTAIAVAGALAIAGGAAAERVITQSVASSSQAVGIPMNMVQAIGFTNKSIPVDATTVDPGKPSAPDLSSVRRDVADIAPGATFEPLYQAVFDAAPQPINTGTDPIDQFLIGGPIEVADEAWIARVGLGEADRTALDSYGVLVMHAYDMVGGAVDELQTITIDAEPTAIRVQAPLAVGRPVNQQLTYQQLVITPTKARQLGLNVIESGFIASAPKALSPAQRGALSRLQQSLYGNPDSFTPVDEAERGIGLVFPYPSSTIRPALIRGAILAAALLFTLLIVAIGLALSAVESRDERDVLASIGARPAAMRRVAGLKAGWLALAGGVLAIPTGYLPVWSAMSASTPAHQIGVPFPWWIAGGILIVIPLVAGVGAWLASSIAQAVRPVRMSSLSAD